MVKINAYVPTDKYKKFANPSTKPFKSGEFGYQPKERTVQDQVYKKLKQIAHYVDFMFEDQAFTGNGFKKNIETLHQDLEKLKISLKEEPYDFIAGKFKFNERWITEMRSISEKLKNAQHDEHHASLIGKLIHKLNELDHLIRSSKNEEQEPAKPNFAAPVKFKPIPPQQSMGTKTVKTTKPKTALTKTAKPKKKISVAAETKTTRKPAKKAAATPKKTVKTTKKAAPITKKAVKAEKKPVKKVAPVKKSAAKPVKKSAQKPAAKSTSAKKK